MLSFSIFEDSLQTEPQARQKHQQPEIDVFKKDVFMVEVKGNHGKSNST